MTKGVNTRAVQDQRILDSLYLAHNLGGWVTTPILAWWFWPTALARKKYAERLMADMIEQGLLLKRTLPNRSNAGVVTVSGVRRANDLMVDYTIDSSLGDASIKPGTDWGKSNGGEWTPPTSWQHQLRSGKFLSWIRGMSKGRISTVMFDTEIQRSNPTMFKRPDGLFTVMPLNESKSPTSFWVEVESARKTGPNLTALIDALIDVKTGHAPQIFRETWAGKEAIQTTEVVVVVPSGFNEKPFDRKFQARMNDGGRLPDINLRIYREDGDGFVMTPKKYQEIW